MATVHPQSPAGPTPLPQEERHGDATPDPPAVSGEPAAAAGAEEAGGEIAALDKQLAVGGEERRPAGAASAGGGGGGKLVAEAMRKYAAPRSSRFHGVTRYDDDEHGGVLVLPACRSLCLRLCSGLFDLGGCCCCCSDPGQAQVERQVRGAPLGQHQPGPGTQAQGQARYATLYQPPIRALAHWKIIWIFLLVKKIIWVFELEPCCGLARNANAMLTRLHFVISDTKYT